MKPLLVLVMSFVTAVFAIRLNQSDYDFYLAARIAMSMMLLFTALGHFMYTKGMTMMIPRPIPFKLFLVYFTGVMEIIMAVTLLIPRLTVFTGWIIMLFLMLLLPANIYAAMNQVDYQKGTFKGDGIKYLWFRVPLQLFFIMWVYFSSIL